MHMMEELSSEKMILHRSQPSGISKNMSAIEEASRSQWPPKPTIPPPHPEVNRRKVMQKDCYSMDLNIFDQAAYDGDERLRRRSNTLESQSSSYSGLGWNSRPHVDSSGISSKNASKATQVKTDSSSSPLSSHPHPPPPWIPQSDPLERARKSVPVDDPTVPLRRSSSVNSSSRDAVCMTLEKLNSRPGGPREWPYPTQPEGSSSSQTNTSNKATPTSAPDTPTLAVTPSSPGNHTLSALSTTTQFYHAQQASSSSHPTIEDEEIREKEEGKGEQTGVNYRSNAATTDDANFDPPTANQSCDPDPVIPPRPFMPPRPFPPKHLDIKGDVSRRRATKHGESKAAVKMTGEKSSSSMMATKSHRATKGPKRLRHMSHQSPLTPNTPPNVFLTPTSEVDKKMANVTSEEVQTENNNCISLTTNNGPKASTPQNEGVQCHGETTPSVTSQQTLRTTKKKVSFQNEDSFIPDKEIEAVDQLTPLQSTSPKKGRRMINSMRRKFKSFHVAKTKPPKRDCQAERNRCSSESEVDKSTVSLDTPPPTEMLNPLVVQCVAYLNKESVLLEEGLFRVPGDLSIIRKLREKFIYGVEVDLNDVLDPHTVTGLLKLHFRELKVSLIPRGGPVTDIMNYIKNNDVEAVRNELNNIDESIISTLCIVMEMLTKITAQSSKNYMTPNTLATSCGPSLFPYLPPSSANQITRFLIDNCSYLFCKKQRGIAAGLERTDPNQQDDPTEQEDKLTG